MKFKDNLNKICKDNGTTLTAVIKELGISSSKVTAINHGSLPKEDMLLALAKHLNCSVMDFFADEEPKENTLPQDDDEDDILRVYRNLDRREKHEFMSMVYKFDKNV